MPLARIRSFDPEAIAFLAAQLAQSGYTLQFVRPDETGLEQADLELTVVRRDLDAALQIAHLEAERLGTDVTVVPGAMPVPEPAITAADIPEPAPFLSEIEMPTSSEVPLFVAEQPAGHDIAVQKIHFAQIAKESFGKTAHILGRGLGKAVDALEVVRDSIGRSLVQGKDNLVELGDTSAAHFNEWKVRFLTARALRREARQRETLNAKPAPARVVRIKEVPRRPQPLWLRERIYMGVAVASILVAAAIIGWSFAGSGGPANPVGKGTGLSTVQEQVPFGPASVTAPAVVNAAAVRVSQKISGSKPKPAAVRPSSRVRRASASDDDGEVVVRHFDRKPVAEQQAKAKTRDGVKVISEE